MDLNKDVNMIDEFFSYVKNFNNRILEIKRNLNNFVSREEFNNQLKALKEELGNVEKTLNNYREILNEDLLDKVRYLNDLKLKIDVLENNQKNFIDYSSIVNVKSKINKLELDINSLSNKITKYEDVINGIKDLRNKIEDLTDKLNKIKDSYTNINDFNDLKLKVDNLTNLLSKTIDNLSKDLLQYNKISEMINEIDKIEEINEKYNKLEEGLNNIKEETRKIKAELYDSKDILESVLSDYENLMNRIKKIENFIDLANFEYIINEIEKIKIIENDIENIKRLLLSKNIKAEEEYKY